MKTTYKGWNITIRCLPSRAQASGRGQADSFTASARAVLQESARSADWIDARTQVVTLRGQIFETAAACGDVLLAEMTVLLDALMRIAPEPARAS